MHVHDSASMLTSFRNSKHSVKYNVGLSLMDIVSHHRSACQLTCRIPCHVGVKVIKTQILGKHLLYYKTEYISLA